MFQAPAEVANSKSSVMTFQQGAAAAPPLGSEMSSRFVDCVAESMALNPELYRWALMHGDPDTLMEWILLAGKAEIVMDFESDEREAGTGRRQGQAIQMGSRGSPGKLTEESEETPYARRRRLGLCLYCGESGHMVATCPAKPAARMPPPPRATKRSNPKSFKPKKGAIASKVAWEVNSEPSSSSPESDGESAGVGTVGYLVPTAEPPEDSIFLAPCSFSVSCDLD
ncbi:uncharacterized protein LOC125440920 isoform X2 [Sphaerodactylus townsendi]|uniref:uncharacterized protein LOC125440920 isoform X2 n=1 Tax=Sphaerodactylus townsendi TaxID=933632 RepID=UPI002026BEBC|nr:uncharacterized protein LOC125440920 isoform X2 [Sphaerodactylus townsendi]